MDQIYQDGRHYDLLFPTNEQSLHFWLDQGRQYGDPILELACGTGRLTIPLAQQGHAMTGIDLSAAMLAEARRKAALANVEIEWLYGDIRNFDLDRTFRLMILANNALCHLHTLADFEQCMACVKRHLQPAGRFVVEVFVPKLELLLQTPAERQPFAVYDDPDGAGQIVVTHTSQYDSATQIKYNTTYYKLPNQAGEIAGTLNMRMYFPQELDALFKYNGFAIEHKYGETDLRPFDAAATMQIFVLSHA
jgi:SAM-dependent methyltransferase